MIRVSTLFLVSVLGASAAFAQAATPAPVNAPLLPDPAPASSTKPAASKPPSAAPATDKQALSKRCSTEADQKGLHGKARKAYRSKCKAGQA